MSDTTTTTDADADEEEFDRDAHAVTVLGALDVDDLHSITELGTESIGQHATDVVKSIRREVRGAYQAHRVDSRTAGRIAEQIGEDAALGDDSRILAQAAALVFYLAPLAFGESPDEVQAGRQVRDALRDALRVAVTGAAQRLITHVEEEVDSAEDEWDEAHDTAGDGDEGKEAGQDSDVRD